MLHFTEMDNPEGSEYLIGLAASRSSSTANPNVPDEAQEPS
jgi:hypothetical protein